MEETVTLTVCVSLGRGEFAGKASAVNVRQTTGFSRLPLVPMEFPVHRPLSLPHLTHRFPL